MEVGVAVDEVVAAAALDRVAALAAQDDVAAGEPVAPPSRAESPSIRATLRSALSRPAAFGVRSSTEVSSSPRSTSSKVEPDRPSTSRKRSRIASGDGGGGCRTSAPIVRSAVMPRLVALVGHPVEAGHALVAVDALAADEDVVAVLALHPVGAGAADEHVVADDGARGRTAGRCRRPSTSPEAPPSSQSSPSLPSISSATSPPMTMSLPWPPKISSSSSPPLTKSSPRPPSTRSMPGPALIVSSPSPPWMHVVAELVGEAVVAVAAQERVVAGAALQDVVAAVAPEGVVALAGDQPVDAVGAAQHHVVAPVKRMPPVDLRSPRPPARCSGRSAR